MYLDKCCSSCNVVKRSSGPCTDCKQEHKTLMIITMPLGFVFAIVFEGAFLTAVLLFEGEGVVFVFSFSSVFRGVLFGSSDFIVVCKEAINRSNCDNSSFSSVLFTFISSIF